jgi:hypothetical protein
LETQIAGHTVALMKENEIATAVVKAAYKLHGLPDEADPSF